MTLETVMQILYANNLTEVVVLATQIDNKISFGTPPKVLIVEIHDNQLPKDHKFANDRSYGYVACDVIGFDQFKLKEQYLVQLPNGMTKWCSINTNAKLSEVIDNRLTTIEAIVDKM